MDSLVNIITNYWSVILGFIFLVSLLFNFFFVSLKNMIREVNSYLNDIQNKLDKNESDIKIIKDSILSSQRSELLRMCEICLSEKKASSERKQTISELYNTYHQLGGDSFITEMVKRVVSLPNEKKKREVLNENK